MAATSAKFASLLVCVWACACGPAATHPSARPAHAEGSRGPAPAISSDEDLAAGRSAFEALPLGAPDRSPRRSAIERYLLAQSRRALEGGHLEEAFEFFKQALTLYDADELHGTIADGQLLGAADRLEHALRRRGQHQEVLATLAAQMSLAPSPEVRVRYDQILSWLRSGGATESDTGTVDGHERVIEDLEAVVRVWPSPFVVRELRQLYSEHPTLAAEGQAGMLNRRVRRGADLRELLTSNSRAALSYQLARLYLRVSRMDEAAHALESLRNQPADDPQLRGLVAKWASAEAKPQDAIALAMQLAQPPHDDRDVAERICRDASRRFPRASEPRLCVGQLALSLNQLGIATASFEEAVQLDPGRREAWEALARLYQERLVLLVSDENLDVNGLEPQIKRVEAFYAEAEKRFPGHPLRPSLAGAFFEVGRGYFNGGRVAEATKNLERSLQMEPSAPALELLGQLHLKRGHGREAAALFERAVQVPKPDRAEQLFWRAKLRRQLGDAFETLGDAEGAQSARRAALADWDAVTGAGSLTPEGLTEAGLERAKLHYQLGEREESLRNFQKAIDAQPDRGSSYADAIAFLVPRGELEEALDAYHRALGRNEVTDYLKVYCSLWIIDLARRTGQPEDPLATAYLQSTDGAKWFDDLARWATARENETTLLQRADTPARKAESAFYRAMKALESGNQDGAIKLWRQVIDTDMMAFFEYDMAAYYLRHGPAVKPELQSKPPKERARDQRPGSRPPEGSI